MSEFPHANIETNQPELFIRDIDFLNYHINHDKWDWFRNFDIIDAVRQEDDFTFLEVDLYSIAQDAGGSYGVADAVNGIFALVNHADNDDDSDIAQDAETWLLAVNHPLYFECRVKISDALDADFYIGLIDTAGYFSVGCTNGVFFWKPDGNPDLYLRCLDNSVATDTACGIDLEDDDWVRLAFHWDGKDTLRWFVFEDGDAPQACVATGSLTAGFVNDHEMNFGMGIRNGEAAAKTASIDYYKLAMSRN